MALTEEEYQALRREFMPRDYPSKKRWDGKRRFFDAPDEVRCQASVVMKDGTTAQCGRRECMDGLGYCWQHQRQLTSPDADAKALDAELRGNSWLAKANQYRDAGDSEKADKCYSKGQYWLDRFNKLTGRG
jgi:hypothetical protein